MEINATVIAILFFALLVVIGFALSLLLQRRALQFVIGNFRKKRAFDKKKSIPGTELGIMPKHALFKKRDYKPQALQFLVNTGVVQMTDEQKFYFSEEKLAALRDNSSTLGKLLLPE